MNSLLYISEYIIQTKNPISINFNSRKFPTGKYYIKRPFIYINLFWTIMPLYILSYYIIHNL